MSWQDTAFATLELVAVETLPEAELAALKADADEYFKALGAWHELRDDVHEFHSLNRSRLADADEVTSRVLASISDSAFRAILEGKVTQIRGHLEHEEDNACWEHPLVGKPAPEWKLPDTEGDVHRLADQRGKVVVLCFWSRECSHCLLALPSLTGLAARWVASDVALFGMHLRSSMEEAQTVSARLNVDFPMLQAAGKVWEYLVHTHRSIYVVDQQGTVPAVLEGDPEGLESELTQAVTSLLE